MYNKSCVCVKVVPYVFRLPFCNVKLTLYETAMAIGSFFAQGLGQRDKSWSLSQKVGMWPAVSQPCVCVFLP